MLDPRTGDHAAIADHHHVAQTETLFQLGDLGSNGGRIGGVAFEHLNRHGATIRGTQQPDHQLRAVTATVAAVAVAGQRTATSFQVGGGDVVEHQGAVLEVAAGELVFDELLLAAKPVEGGVDFARGDAAKTEGFTQRVAGGVGIEHPRGCEFRRRVKQPGDDERQCQVAATLRGSAGQQVVQADAPRNAQRGKDVAMGQRAADLEALAADRGKGVAAQGGAESFDTLDRQLGKIGEGAVLDLAVLAVGFSQ